MASRKDILAAIEESGNLDAIAGSKGATYVTNTTAQTGSWCAIEFRTDTVFTAIASNWDGAAITGITWSAGKTIYGRFTAFQLASGSVIAYKV
jgi:hypothetical protein